MEFGDYLRILRKRWIVIVAATLAGLAVAAAASILTTPIYRASTLVYVQVQSSGSLGDLVQGSNFVQSQVASFAEVVSTPRVLTPAIKALALDETASELAESVSADAPAGLVNIEVTVTRDSPTEAADIANAITESFKQVVQDITSSGSVGEATTSQVSVSVLREASPPRTPTSPDTVINLAVGLLIGLAAGLGIAILRDILDTRIRGERDVASISVSPIIGGIGFDPSAVDKPLIVQDDPRSVRAEAFRTLRTNLQFLNIEQGPKSFVVTSSMPSEGKTTTAANLAIALADSGAHVVLVDADMRRPKLAIYMGLEGAVGLSDVLIGRTELTDALQPWGRGTLAVLPAGAIPPNPSELLGSRAMASLIDNLEKEFDVVILDLPPLLPVTDAAVVSKITRGTLLVVAAGRTRKGELAGAVAALENVDASASGIILTMLPSKGPDAYGYGRYGYGGYGYGEPDPSESGVPSPAASGVRVRRRLAPEWGTDNEPTA
jgi:succinoglycan biosynthesis transport protein ExoP